MRNEDLMRIVTDPDLRDPETARVLMSFDLDRTDLMGFSDLTRDPYDLTHMPIRVFVADAGCQAPRILQKTYSDVGINLITSMVSTRHVHLQPIRGALTNVSNHAFVRAGLRYGIEHCKYPATILTDSPVKRGNLQPFISWLRTAYTAPTIVPAPPVSTKPPEPVEQIFIPECSICMDKDVAVTCVLICKHYFHTRCINAWKEHAPTRGMRAGCPMCRGAARILREWGK